MKIIRGTKDEILSTHLPFWEVGFREDVFCSWSESDLQEKRVCTCGQQHIDTGWDAETYLDTAFELIELVGFTVEEIHISPHREPDMEAIAESIDPGRDPKTLWEVPIRLNPDIGSDKVRVRSLNKSGVPLREVEFSIPWE